MEAIGKAGSGRRKAGNGFEALKRPPIGANRSWRWSRRAERAGGAQVADLELQARSFDPGREALRGAAGSGE